MSGKVTHFSRWNVDYPMASHSAVCGQIVDITGAPIRDAQVRSYGTTYLSNWTKPQRTDGSGTFCDDFKVSEEEEAEEEEERTPPAVRILEAGMSGADQFGVRVEVRYQGDDTVRRLKVKAELTNQGEDSPFATLEDEVGAEQGPVTIDFPFCLVCEGVPRFREHVDVHVEAEALETWSDPTETLTATDEREGRILLPVVITHGIMGDWANISILGWQPGYSSVGPGFPEMAASLAKDGYEEGDPYPTLYLLTYPSLHPNGNAWLAQNFMQTQVQTAMDNTYANRADIVAHSMGGLIPRYYIEVLGGEEHVRKLVMIGTPNEGAAGAHISLEEDAFITGYAELSPSTMTVAAVASLLGQDVGATTNMELLPAYDYFCEFPESNPSCPTLGLPTVFPLGKGDSGLLGFNSFLDLLNRDGLSNRVDNFIIYRDNNSTPTDVSLVTGIPVTVAGISVGTSDQSVIIDGPGDATVPVQSAIMSDFPAASAQLMKCRLAGGIHAEMMLDPQIRNMVRAILILDEGDEPPGCNPTGGPLPEDPRDIVDTLRKFIEDQKAHSHLPRELSFTTISGLAGELRRLEDQSPWVLRNMGPQLQAYVRDLSDTEVAALAGALERWGLDTQILSRHAPGLARAAQTAAAAADVSAQRNALEQGVVASFLHNVAQAFIQMMLYATAESHSSEEAGQFASHTADIAILQGFLGPLSTTWTATQTWRPVVPTIAALRSMSPGEAADDTVVKLENLLIALAGEEQYSGWVYRSGSGGLESASEPGQDKGGGERARLLIFWNGKIFTPRVSDIGVDWQDMGVPRLHTSSTSWVGTPQMSEDKPARWIGSVMLEEVGLRQISGRVVAADGQPVPDLTVRGAVSVRSTYGEQLDSESATTGDDGRFTLLVPRDLDIRLTLSHPSARPTQAVPEVPPGTADLDLGDIEVGARPVISGTSVAPARPDRGAPLTLSSLATHPLGQPLTYTWEVRTTRWAWEAVGEGAEVQLTAPDLRTTTTYRVVVSDGVFETDRRISITPANLPPEALSLEAESGQVTASQKINFTAAARDSDGDPLTYNWSCSPGCWWSWPQPTEATATWTAPWSPEDRTYNIQVRVTDGALYDETGAQITVLGRPDPTVSLSSTMILGPAPLEITLTAAAEDPVGQIVEYEWSIQQLSRWRYFYNWRFESTAEGAFTETLDAPGTYRARVRAINDIDRSVHSDWVDILVQAPPVVELTAGFTEGPVPLQVAFTATARDADGEIVEYRWDFDGDGTVDQTTTTTSASFTYEAAGEFQAQVTAVDDDGLTKSDTLTITPASRQLTATLVAEPGEGPGPLEVSLTATVDPGPVVEYGWDFDGDGVVDESTTGNTATYTYDSSGDYLARVIVTAEDGSKAIALTSVIVLDALPPSVTLTANPTDGGAPLEVTFAASATDPDGQVVEYRWDFDADGTLDQTTTGGTATHTYSGAGTFQPQVTAVDNEGLTGQATTTITVSVCRATPPAAGQTLPHVFVGTAAIDGTPVADGARIVALIGCDIAAQAFVSGGSYTLQVGPAQGESYAGKTVTFTVSGFAAAQTSLWQRGGGTILNLTASVTSGG